MATQATLTSPDKLYKTVVNVGSTEASQLQSRGWGLGDAGTSVLPLDKALTQNANLAPTVTAPAPAPVVAPAPATAPTAPTIPNPAPAPSTAPTTPTATAPAATGAKATLYGPTGTAPVVVDVGSGQASSLQSQGWGLTPGSFKAPAPAPQPIGTPLPAGMTQLTDPSQISQFNIAGQIGETGTPGSFLYGTPKNAAPGTAQPDMTGGAGGMADTNGAGGAGGTATDQTGGNFDLASLFGGSGGTGGSSLDQPTTDLLAKYGITPPSASGNPVQDYASTYNQLLTSMGLPDIKAQFTQVQQKYAALQNELNDKISAVNDDPWLSEGQRVGQAKSLQSKYEGRLQILNDQQKLYDSLYQQGVQQAQYVANASFQQQKFNSDTAFNIANLVQKEQEARASLKSSSMRDQLAMMSEMRQEAAQKATEGNLGVDNARQSLKLAADMFGADAFNNMSASEKRKWEDATGLPPGTLDNQVLASSSGGSNPASYKEWQLAGSPGTYADWVKPTGANKPLTADQAKAATFADRTLEANTILKNIEGQFSSLNSIGGYLPSFMQSADRQQFEQAKRNFVNAVLRRESGAVISPSEFANADKQYFAQPGDSPEVLKQKDQNRQTVIEGLQREAGSSYSPASSSDGGGSGGNNDPLNLGFNQPLSMGEKGSQAEKIALAIKQVESGGNYNAKGASTEGGAYQFMPASWKEWAGKYLNNPNAPQTPTNQDAVATSRIQDLLDQGYNERQVALIWNGGQPIEKKGVNKFGVKYDSGSYANKVLSTYNRLG